MTGRFSRVLIAAATAGLLTSGLTATAASTTTPTTSADDRPRTYTGTIDGADFRAVVPASWNGTLVQYSHGYYPEQFPDLGFPTTNRPETETWLLDHGYAVAASNFKGRTGYLVKQGMHDQVALLDWFEDHVGRPEHTVATGQSLGATIALLLAERRPDLYDGAATICGGSDPVGMFNAVLDINFTIKTLLAPNRDIDLVRPDDAAASTKALVNAVRRALKTPLGRARLALAGAFNNVAAWYSAHDPEPTTLVERIRQQASWVQNAYVAGLGPTARADLEPRAGGNPSWNIGVDYRDQLARSSQQALVRKAYRAADADLGTDLDRLAEAPRIAPDLGALAFLYRYGVPLGTTPTPVVTLHTTGDGGAVADQERWLAERVRRHGDPTQLRQLYVERGGHCSNNAAEEIVALQTLLTRVETGHWPGTSPRRLTEAARELGPKYRLVLDFGTFEEAPMRPSFTKYTPPRFLRPSF